MPHTNLTALSEFIAVVDLAISGLSFRRRLEAVGRKMSFFC
jgi:hypothetical protein